MYDNYIALDWANSNMAVARLSKESERIHCNETRSSVEDLRFYLDNLRGSKILTFEETTTAQWLYTELKESVDEILVCDPYRNKLLSEGAKTDKIDSIKLVQLLRANLLKPVYHSGEVFVEIRKLVSGYNDLVQEGVRLKNQRSAIFRAEGKPDIDVKVNSTFGNIILNSIEKRIELYEEEKEALGKEFEKVVKKHSLVRLIDEIPGIGPIGAVKTASIVVSMDRFPHRNNFLSYCGLVKLSRMSGGKCYGQKLARHRRDLKAVFKTAALSVVKNENEFRNYYQWLMKHKNYSERNARHAVARKIAITVFGVMKCKKHYNQLNLGVFKDNIFKNS